MRGRNRLRPQENATKAVGLRKKDYRAVRGDHELHALGFFFLLLLLFLLILKIFKHAQKQSHGSDHRQYTLPFSPHLLILHYFILLFFFFTGVSFLKRILNDKLCHPQTLPYASLTDKDLT